MLLGYNTNGFAHHRIEDALAILAEIGYSAVAITLEPVFFDPPDVRGVRACVRRLQPILAGAGFSPTIETGSRFMLDPRRKHQPTLISHQVEDRRRRSEFLRAAVDIAAELNATSVSLWSGTATDAAGKPEQWNRLLESLHHILDHAAARDVRISFEPEPGMLIDTMEQVERLHHEINHPLLGLTLDVGHVHCLADGDLTAHIRKWAPFLWNVHIEDMKRGMHEHLPFGDGEMDFPPIFDALRRANYTGPLHVELSHHSHDAVESARRAFAFLRRLV